MQSLYGIDQNGQPVTPGNNSGVTNSSSTAVPGVSQPGTGTGNCPPGLVWNAANQNCVPATPGISTAPAQTPTYGSAPTQSSSATGTGVFSNTTQPTTGAPGTYQAGSPNDPAAQGNGSDANSYLLQLLNGGTGFTPNPTDINNINSQYGLQSGSGLEYYANNGNPYVAASGGGYYAIDPATGKWTYNKGDSGGGGATSNTGGGQIDPMLAYLTGTPSSAAASMPASFQFSPYGGPTPQAITPSTLEAPTAALIQQLMANPSMSPSVVAQMNEAAKDTALAGQQQQAQQINENAAQRGVLSGGAAASQLAALNQQTAGNISGAYRGIATTAAEQNQTDLENAVAASDAFQQYQLSEQQAQGNQATSLFNEWATSMGLQSQAQQQAFANWLSAQGINLQYLGLGQNAFQFDSQQQLANAQFLANG